jgi:hypothetical protein
VNTPLLNVINIKELRLDQRPLNTKAALAAYKQVNDYKDDLLITAL